MKSIRIDLEISLQDLSPQFLREITLFEPFGAGNPKPVFLTRDVRTKKNPERAGTNALRWWVTDGTMTFEAVWRSRSGQLAFPDLEPYSIVYSPKLTSWDGLDHLILEVRDVKAKGACPPF